MTLYTKTMRGKRAVYTPAAESVEWDSLPEGFHLVAVQPGLRSCMYRVNPATADLLAALKLCREAAITAMREASAERPSSRLLTPVEREALAAYYAVAGPEARFTMTIPAASDVLDAIEAVLLKA